MVEEYSLGELVSVYNDYINTRFNDKVIKITGIYKRGRSNQCYNNYCYSCIKSINEEFQMTLRVSRNMWNKLKDNVVYSFKGCIYKKVTDQCNIRLEFLVTDILECKDIYINKERIHVENEIKNEKLKNRYKDLGTVLRKKFDEKNEVTIALIIGENAIVDEDIYSPLGEYIRYYKFNTYRTRLNKHSILQTLEKLKSSNEDIVLLARGGGSERELSVFNDIDIARKIAEFNSTFVTAIGHAVNYNLAQEVADRKFETPSLVGQYFREIAEEAEENFNKKKLIVDMANELEASGVIMSNNNSNKKIYIGLIILIIGIFIGKYMF